MKYAVTVEITMTYAVEIEASSAEEAEDKALDMDYDDMTEVDDKVEAFAQEAKAGN